MAQEKPKRDDIEIKAQNRATNKKTLKVLGIIVLVIFILIILLSRGENNTKNDKTKADKPQLKTEQAKPTIKKISQSDAEDVCQDAGFLQNYITLKNVSVINGWNYSPTFVDIGEGISELVWSGKDKTNDKPILFSCYVKKDGNKTVVSGLAINANMVYGEVFN